MAVMTFTFSHIPNSVEELKAFPEADLQNGFKSAALAVLSLLTYETNPTLTFQLLDFLNGPDSISEYTKQFIKDRIQKEAYIVRSFFKGATVDNNYTPTTPLTISVSSTPYSFQEENYGTVYVTSAGADSPRPIKVRRKPSTGQWFVIDIQCLADIRKPKELDPWA